MVEIDSRLQFDEGPHVYRLDRSVVPGITQVMDDMGFTDATWFQQHHRDRGTAAHVLCAEVAYLERPDSGEDWDGTCGCSAAPNCSHQVAIPYALSFQKWVRHVGFIVEPGMVEFLVCSYAWRLAGKVDLWGWIGTNRVLVDIKTGAPQSGAKIQLASYRRMAKESRGIETDASFCLALDKDGGFPKVVESSEPSQDERIAQSLMECWWWRNQHGLLPKNGRK